MGALAPFPLPGLKSLKKGGGRVPGPSAEADGKGRKYSSELSVAVITTRCNSSFCHRLSSSQHYPRRFFFLPSVYQQPALPVALLLFSVGFSRRLRPPPCPWGFSPLSFAGTKVPKKGGGRVPGPSAEADGKGRTYSSELSVAVSSALSSSFCCRRPSCS